MNKREGAGVRVLVCGSRGWTDSTTIQWAMNAAWQLAQRDFHCTTPEQVTVLHGAAHGADRLCASVAANRGFRVEAMPADWNRHGKAAGPIRNLAMLDTHPDVVLAFQVAGSRGTQHTIDEAERRGIPVTRFGKEQG